VPPHLLVYYILLSGRCLAPRLSEGLGATLVVSSIGFLKSPTRFTEGPVLSPVPGTVEASDAVMLAQIPRTSIVNKSEAESQSKSATSAL